MTSAFCAGVATLIGATAVQAQTSKAPSPEVGTVHQLSEIEKEALFERLAQRDLAEPAEAAARTRPGKVERIGLGILGYLGSAAADAAVDRRCRGSLQCRVRWHHCFGERPRLPLIDYNTYLLRSTFLAMLASCVST